MSEIVVISAPWVICLSGEAGIAGGNAALYAATNQRMLIAIRRSKKDQIEPSPHLSLISDVLVFLRNNHLKGAAKDSYWNIRVTTPRWIGSGEQSIVVTTISALLFITKKLWNPPLANQLAYEYWKSRGDIDSGGVTTATTFGGFVWYRRELPFLQSIWQLPMTLDNTLQKFVYVGKEPTFTKKDSRSVSARDIAIALREGNEKRLVQYFGITPMGGIRFMQHLPQADISGKMVPIILGEEGIRIEKSPSMKSKSDHTTDNQQEFFVVVDKDDRVLGYKTRYACHHDKSFIHRGVNLVIFDKDGRMLLQKRSMTKDTSAGYWTNACGGHVGRGETYEEAVIREANEELGVEVQPTRIAKFIYHWPQETEMEVVFTAVHNGPFIVNKEEVDKVKFFTRLELEKNLYNSSIQLTSLAQHIFKKYIFVS